MKYLSQLHYFLGIEFTYSNNSFIFYFFYLNQTKRAIELTSSRKHEWSLQNIIPFQMWLVKNFMQ